MTVTRMGSAQQEVSLDATTSFDEVYEAHYPRLVRVLRLDGLSLADSEDLAQEAFSRAVGRWGLIARGANPAGYIYTTAFRLRRRRRAPSDAAGSVAPAEPDPSLEVVALLEVERLLAMLSATQRRCLAMYYLADLSTEDIGRILGVSPSTVRVHLHRARGRLTGKEL